MKRFVALVLALVMCLSIPACGNVSKKSEQVKPTLIYTALDYEDQSEKNLMVSCTDPVRNLNRRC